MDWGKKLILGLALFMIFIMGLGTIMILRSDDDALIEKDYYEKGQLYDTDYQAKVDAINDGVVPAVKTGEHGITITFPLAVSYSISCKRLSDSKMDRKFESFSAKAEQIELLKGDLQPGPYRLKIEYTVNGNKYLFENEIMMP